MKKIIDLSGWNVVNSYEKVSKSGIDGAIVKIINSSNSIDKRFNEHCNGLKNYNVQIIGGYNYLYANTVTKAVNVAPKLIELAISQNIKTVWLDIEDNCMKNLGKRIADIVNVYITYAKKYNIYIGIYSGQYFYNTYIKPYEAYFEFKLPVWIARYPSTATCKVSDPIPSTNWMPTNIDIDGWQYSSNCIIDGINGKVDLSVWWEDTPFVNLEPSILISDNPFTEPTYNVKLGTMGNDANWVLWYLWKFGKLVDDEGNADSTKINGFISTKDVEYIKEVQSILGLESDGVVGKITKSVWKKMC